MSRKKKTIWNYMNKWILFITLGLAILGAFLILDASSISSVLRYHHPSPYFYFERQLIMIAIGLVGSLIILRFPTSTYKTISLAVSLIMLGIMVITFGLSLVGLFLGKKIIKLLKGRYEISGIIGGCILILLAVWVILSHYLPL